MRAEAQRAIMNDVIGLITGALRIGEGGAVEEVRHAVAASSGGAP
jgi:hypothetical protein